MMAQLCRQGTHKAGSALQLTAVELRYWKAHNYPEQSSQHAEVNTRMLYLPTACVAHPLDRIDCDFRDISYLYPIDGHQSSRSSAAVSVVLRLNFPRDPEAGAWWV